MDNYGRSPLDKCPLHSYPHRFYKGQAGFGSTLLQAGEGQISNTQGSFDYWWNSFSPEMNENESPGSPFKPVVNWERETAFFLRIPVQNSCEKVMPYGDEMTTDCLTINFTLLRVTEGQDCHSMNSYPVFVYIFPKVNLPYNVQSVYPTPTPTFSPTATPPFTPTPTPEPEEGGE